eukprot:1191463-Prorocentrum_minimum.AAC.1
MHRHILFVPLRLAVGGCKLRACGLSGGRAAAGGGHPGHRLPARGRSKGEQQHPNLIAYIVSCKGE